MTTAVSLRDFAVFGVVDPMTGAKTAVSAVDPMVKVVFVTRQRLVIPTHHDDVVIVQSYDMSFTTNTVTVWRNLKYVRGSAPDTVLHDVRYELGTCNFDTMEVRVFGLGASALVPKESEEFDDVYSCLDAVIIQQFVWDRDSSTEQY